MYMQVSVENKSHSFMLKALEGTLAVPKWEGFKEVVHVRGFVVHPSSHHSYPHPLVTHGRGWCSSPLLEGRPHAHNVTQARIHTMLYEPARIHSVHRHEMGK